MKSAIPPGYRLLTLLGLVAALAVPNGACRAAEASAPALFNVKEVLLQPPRIGDPQAATLCGAQKGDIGSELLRDLHDRNVPVVAAMESKPPVIGAARIELVPEIISLNEQGIDCVSWVALTAQSQNAVVVPPVETPRNVTVSYWRGGMLVSSSEGTHTRAILEAILKLSKKFAARYKIDQPPPLPNFDAPK